MKTINIARHDIVHSTVTSVGPVNYPGFMVETLSGPLMLSFEDVYPIDTNRPYRERRRLVDALNAKDDADVPKPAGVLTREAIKAAAGDGSAVSRKGSGRMA